MRHGVVEVDRLDAPIVPLELVDNPPSEVLVVYGIEDVSILTHPLV